MRDKLYTRLNAAAKNGELLGDAMAERCAEGAILPIYGMPSRVRNLYHGVYKRNGQLHLRSVDRELELAISEFAPGAEKTKDKRVLKSIGFTADLVVRSGKVVPADPVPVVDRGWLSRCTNCHYTKPSSEEPEKPDGQPRVCPHCGAGEEEDFGIRVFRISVPKAFRTDLGRGQDSQEEFQFLAGGATTFAESDPADVHQVAGTNCATSLTRLGNVYRLNDRDGSFFQGALGSVRRGNYELDNQWIDERFQHERRLTFTPSDDPEEFALAAPKVTDVLRIQPAAVHPGLSMDPVAFKGLPTHGAIKAAYYSAAFIIRDLAGEMLDTDPEEFEVTNVRQVQLLDGSVGGEIALGDYLPNGAGFVAEIGERWEELLQIATDTEAPPKTYIGWLISPRHRSECQSSGYDCLRQYRNMRYHGLLDFRLGIALLRSLQTDGYSAGLDNDFSAPELADWPDLARVQRDQFCEAFPCDPREFGPLPGFESPTGVQVIVIHPLWNRDQRKGLLAEAMAATTVDTVEYVDTFNLLKRQSWVYKQLAQLP